MSGSEHSRVLNRLLRSLRRGPMEGLLSSCVEVKVRFSEVDSLRMVWHGVYLRYLEDAREHFGLQYPGLGYTDFYHSGYIAPIVDIRLEYLTPLRYGTTVRVECYYVPVRGAKIVMGFRVVDAQSDALAAVGYSVQVFVREGETQLELVDPPFYSEWKQRWLTGSVEGLWGA